MRSAAHLEAFLIKQGMLFLHVSNVLGMCRGMRVRSHASYAEAWVSTRQLVWVCEICHHARIYSIMLVKIAYQVYPNNLGKTNLEQGQLQREMECSSKHVLFETSNQRNPGNTLTMHQSTTFCETRSFNK